MSNSDSVKMKNFFFIFCLSVFWCLGDASDFELQRVSLEAYPDAVTMDGSPAVYYLQTGQRSFKGQKSFKGQ